MHSTLALHELVANVPRQASAQTKAPSGCLAAPCCMLLHHICLNRSLVKDVLKGPELPAGPSYHQHVHAQVFRLPPEAGALQKPV